MAFQYVSLHYITITFIPTVNHKMDDEIQKNLNRQCLRKVLGNLDVERETSENDERNDQEMHVKETMNISE